MKRFTAALIITALSLSLCGCGGLFDREYVVVEKYEAPQSEPGDSDKVNVSDFEGLKEAILDFVSAGESEGSIRFDPTYEGESIEDMAAACWQIRSQDALCAYCVKNIAYELKKIVNYTEADIHISYAGAGRRAEDVVRMEYSSGVKEHIIDACSSGATRLAVLINRSSYSAEEMENLADRAYRSQPGCSPVKPSVSVNLFSGSGSQRLYEFNFDYGMSREDYSLRRAQMKDFAPFADSGAEELSEAQRAYLACSYLSENCRYDKQDRSGSIFSALFNGSSGSEGMAFAYVDLCRRLGLDCRIVYGQYEWEDYCWNIVRIDGEYYHVDIARCASSGAESGFLLRDENIWESHRWDLSSYPQCRGSLRAADIIGTV